MHWINFKEWNLPQVQLFNTGVITPKRLLSMFTITENLIFQVYSHFSMIFYKILKFHDISMTGKATVIFQSLFLRTSSLSSCWMTQLLVICTGPTSEQLPKDPVITFLISFI